MKTPIDDVLEELEAKRDMLYMQANEIKAQADMLVMVCAKLRNAIKQGRKEDAA